MFLNLFLTLAASYNPMLSHLLTRTYPENKTRKIRKSESIDGSEKYNKLKDRDLYFNKTDVERIYKHKNNGFLDYPKFPNNKSENNIKFQMFSENRADKESLKENKNKSSKKIRCEWCAFNIKRNNDLTLYLAELKSKLETMSHIFQKIDLFLNYEIVVNDSQHLRSSSPSNMDKYCCVNEKIYRNPNSGFLPNKFRDIIADMKLQCLDSKIELQRKNVMMSLNRDNDGRLKRLKRVKRYNSE